MDAAKPAAIRADFRRGLIFADIEMNKHEQSAQAGETRFETWLKLN
jgi:hypothetical protein